MRTIATAVARLAFVVGVAGCGADVEAPRAQWIVDVGTDLPIPQFGDRVLVELLARDGSSACNGCRRLFGAREAGTWPLSFGIPDPGDGKERWLRVRLFRADHSDAGGGPLAGLGVDAFGRLPPTGGRPAHVSVGLFGVCAGVAADIAGGRSCVDGALRERVFDDTTPLPRTGTFAAAATTPCGSAPSAGMVCIPGGLYARGNAALVADPRAPTRPAPERLVQVSPFAIDVHETTVGEWRALVAAGRARTPRVRSVEDQACTYTEAPGDLEAHPVNCIDRDAAAAACAARGKRLPTEAEWELAAGNRTDETRFPWGDEPDACAWAIVGRGRSGTEAPKMLLFDETTTCRKRPDAEPLPWGPRPVGESRDVTFLGVRDMGGNMSEWVADDFEPYDGRCSEGPTVLTDPRCTGPTPPVVRGGNWAQLPSFAQAVTRLLYSDTGGNVQVGVRCAVSAP